MDSVVNRDSSAKNWGVTRQDTRQYSDSRFCFYWYCRLATVTIFDGDRDLPLLPVYPLPVYQRSLCDPFITHESDVSREGRTFFPSLVYPLLTRLTYPVSSTDAYGGYDRLRISLSLSTLDFSLTLSIFGKLINRYPRN